MNLASIDRILAPKDRLDFSAKGAAMRLAWTWTAQTLWQQCKYNTDHRALFAENLSKASAQVKAVRARMAKMADPRIAALNAERDALWSKPLGVQIGPRLDQINAEIAAILG